MNLFKRFLPAVLLLIGTGSYAQEMDTAVENYDQGFRLGFGLSAGLVTEDEFKAALGADVRLQYDLTSDTSLTFTTGYSSLLGDDGIPDLGFIPVKVGFKAFMLQSRFYVMGETGVGFAVTDDYDEATFIWSPAFGYANDTIDISIRYEDLNSYYDVGQIALRIAYGFKI